MRGSKVVQITSSMDSVFKHAHFQYYKNKNPPYKTMGVEQCAVPPLQLHNIQESVLLLVEAFQL